MDTNNLIILATVITQLAYIWLPILSVGAFVAVLINRD